MADITQLLTSLKRRSAHAKEFGHDVLFLKLEDIGALVEALETKEDQRANWFQMAQKLGEDLDAAEKRNAELESRTVKLPKRSVGEVMHMSGFSRDYAEGWCAGNDNAIHEIQQLGIAVENNGCWHSSVFWDVSGNRCTLCDLAMISAAPKQENL